MLTDLNDSKRCHSIRKRFAKRVLWRKRTNDPHLGRTFALVRFIQRRDGRGNSASCAVSIERFLDLLDVAASVERHEAHRQEPRVQLSPAVARYWSSNEHW